MKIDAMSPLEDQLGCFGYFGFGAGVELALLGPGQRNRRGDAPLYCSGCAQGRDCWQRHRLRVQTMFPDLTALVDQITATHKGVDYILELCRQTGQNPNSPLSEPYACVMMGNMEDGATIAHDQAPKDRGPDTLTWPLERLT